MLKRLARWLLNKELQEIVGEVAGAADARYSCLAEKLKREEDYKLKAIQAKLSGDKKIEDLQKSNAALIAENVRLGNRMFAETIRQYWQYRQSDLTKNSTKDSATQAGTPEEPQSAPEPSHTSTDTRHHSTDTQPDSGNKAAERCSKTAAGSTRRTRNRTAAPKPKKQKRKPKTKPKKRVS